MGPYDSFQDLMNRILPPSKDHKPGVTFDGERQGYGAKRKGRSKGHEGRGRRNG